LYYKKIIPIPKSKSGEIEEVKWISGSLYYILIMREGQAAWMLEYAAFVFCTRTCQIRQVANYGRDVCSMPMKQAKSSAMSLKISEGFTDVIILIKL
jgi:hypothetical protein